MEEEEEKEAGWEGEGRKRVSHQKNLISHSDTHENWGRKVGGGVGEVEGSNGCD